MVFQKVSIVLAAWRDAISELDPGFVRNELNGCEYADDLYKRITLDLDCIASGLERQSNRYPPRPDLQYEVFDTIHDSNLNVLDGHEARSHMPSDLRRYAFVASFAAVTGAKSETGGLPGKSATRSQKYRPGPPRKNVFRPVPSPVT